VLVLVLVLVHPLAQLVCWAHTVGTVGDLLLVIGHSLVIGHWSLVMGHWSLVIGHWSLVIVVLVVNDEWSMNERTVQ